MIGRAIAAAALCVVAGACTATYPVVGSFDNYNEVFKGTVNADMLHGTSFIEVTGKNTGVKCTGGSRVVHVPASNYIAGMFLVPYCAGQKGIADVICDDGHRFLATWTADSCTSGYGSGFDRDGTKFQFAFGMSETDAQKRFRTEAAAASTRRAFPTYRPKETRKKIGFSSGTAFLVSADGYLVTNNHVIEDATAVSILVDGKMLPVRVVTRDTVNDVAVLKAEIHGTPVIVPADAEAAVAEDVMTLGYPLITIQGQALKATFGHVNALSGIGDDIRWLQIDVPIQPGNSGGPLLNDRGELVGIVTATVSQVETLRQAGTLAQNVNYAVKPDYVRILLKGIPTVGTGGEKTDFKSLVVKYRKSIFLVIAK